MSRDNSLMFVDLLGEVELFVVSLNRTSERILTKDSISPSYKLFDNYIKI